MKRIRCLVKMYTWNIISVVFRRKQMMVSFEGDIYAELVFEYFVSIAWIALCLYIISLDIVSWSSSWMHGFVSSRFLSTLFDLILFLCGCWSIIWYHQTGAQLNNCDVSLFHLLFQKSFVMLICLLQVLLIIPFRLDRTFKVLLMMSVWIIFLSVCKYQWDWYDY